MPARPTRTNWWITIPVEGGAAADIGILDFGANDPQARATVEELAQRLLADGRIIP
ncbi:hypothetical protein [Gordonia sihwensis]|uniref:hypothetical protein n=1 Tax=Gordonia sihwensis TaxID=173559 RepID=UPI003D992F7E